MGLEEEMKESVDQNVALEITYAEELEKKFLKRDIYKF